MPRLAVNSYFQFSVVESASLRGRRRLYGLVFFSLLFYSCSCWTTCTVNLIRLNAYLEPALAAERTDSEVIHPFLHLEGYDPLQKSRVGRLANGGNDVSLGIDHVFGRAFRCKTILHGDHGQLMLRG